MSKTEPSGEREGQGSDFYEDVKRQHLAPLWRQRRRPTHGRAVPHLWKWPMLRAEMMRSADVVSTEDIERRVLGLMNPGLEKEGIFATTPNLVGAVQLILPGEVAVAHHHTPAALRVILESERAYTCTDGERCWMEPGDVILTPAWTYHDHGNEGDKPALWLDGLDAPLIQAMDTVFFERYPGQTQQPQQELHEASVRRFRVAGMRPAGYSWDKTYSPLTKYPWRDMVQALNEMPAPEASEFDDLRLEYFNPHTGGPVMPTIACYAQRLRGGVHTRRHRHSSVGIFYVFRGSGHTVVEDERLEWSAGDIFVIPGWHWHEHVNAASSEDAILISYTDEPLLKSLGIHQEEADGSL